MLTDAIINVLDISSRSVIGRRDINCCVAAGVEADVHTVRDIDPGDPSNIRRLVAVE